MSDLITITDQEYSLIRNLIYQRFGINLGERKRSLVMGRLYKELRQQGFRSFQEYMDFISADSSGQALSILIDRISTNHTFFFRENSHFQFYSEQILPAFIKSYSITDKPVFRIWSAGCSSGEEPYTLAMLTQEAFRNSPALDFRILATDISHKALQKAIAGTYPNENVSRLPEKFISEYFRQMPDGWKVKEPIVRKVLFRRLNLMRSEFPFKNRFQVIFCRNVMIYFDQDTRDALVQRLSRYLQPGGYLFTGHSESLGRSNHHFQYIQPAVYQKREAAES
ncbi:MAG: CheR family methyltransferase [Calditrichia bacterium]